MSRVASQSERFALADARLGGRVGAVVAGESESVWARQGAPSRTVGGTRRAVVLELSIRLR